MEVLSIVAAMREPRSAQASGGIWCVVCGLLLLGGLDASAQTAVSKEYQVKAVFLFNFTQFV